MAKLENRALQDFGQAQRDRLAFIELKLLCQGMLTRADLFNRFRIQGAAATRDFGLYQILAPGNVVYNRQSKSYEYGHDFKPLFNFDSSRLLAWIKTGYSEGEPRPTTTQFLCSSLKHLAMPALHLVSVLSRAIYQHKPVTITYSSMHSLRKETREIVPFAFVDNGQRWHVRAYDRKNQRFSDFVLLRIENANILPGFAQDHETPEQDTQWSRYVEAEVVPHPRLSETEQRIVASEFQMKNGVYFLRERAAVIGYVLRNYIIDCSKDHHLDDPSCFLWLKDPLVLYKVDSANIAPAYQE